MPQNGNTALHVASQNGHTGVVAVLLAAGAEPDARNTLGNTPLHMVGPLPSWLLPVRWSAKPRLVRRF